MVSNTFEHLQPPVGRESVFKKISCHNLTAVPLSPGSKEYELTAIGLDTIGFTAPDSGASDRFLALRMDTDSMATQRIPTRHAALIPMDRCPPFSVYIGPSGKAMGLGLLVDPENRTVTYGTQKKLIDGRNPVLAGRNPRDVWKDGVPKPIAFSERTADHGASGKHASLSLIMVDGKPHILVEDLSKYGTSVQMHERPKKRQDRTDANLLITDPELSLPNLLPQLSRIWSFFSSSSQSMFDSNPKIQFDSNPNLMFDSNPGLKHDAAVDAVSPERKRTEKRIGAVSRQSPLHEKNEDAYRKNEKRGFALVCDGMGGHAYGDIASNVAADVIESYERELKPDDPPVTVELALREALDEAAVAVREKTRGLGGTTASAAKIIEHDGRRTLIYAHAGDSRIAILRNGSLIPVTQDQSRLWYDYRRGAVTAEEFKRIEQLLDTVEDPSTLDENALKYFNQRHIMASCLGQGQAVIDSGQVELLEGDKVVLYSDAVTDSMTTMRIALGLGRSDDPQEQANALANDVQRYANNPANVYVKDRQMKKRGKPDDLTVIVME